MTAGLVLPKTATVTSKMQLAIPVRIARKLGLKPGQKVHVTDREGRIVVTPIEPIWLLRPFRGLRRRTREARSV